MYFDTWQRGQWFPFLKRKNFAVFRVKNTDSEKNYREVYPRTLHPHPHFLIRLQLLFTFSPPSHLSLRSFGNTKYGRINYANSRFERETMHKNILTCKIS